jgi:2-(1,2-epoxy-1,2-dihydrophenyl)acetyl-CoA isomerase
MSEGLPRFEVVDGIGRITLDDPATLNSLSPAVFARLGEIFEEVRARADRDLFALVLTGTGRGFCAGAGLSGMVAMAREQGGQVGEAIGRWTQVDGTPVVLAWADLPIPMVTAVNGVTAGIGVSLALAGDVVIAARSASFKLPFLTGLGIVPDGGTTWQLPRLIGTARTTAMALLGDRISAEDAERWGLIWRCVDDAQLLDEAQGLARRLAELPRGAAPEVRGLLAAASRNDFATQYHLELARNVERLKRPAFEEGLSAFFEKRAPRFRAVESSLGKCP